MNKEIDVANNVRIIENLKCSILEDVAHLYKEMLGRRVDSDACADIFADMLIDIYSLSKRMGINYNLINEKAVGKLKLMLLEDNADPELLRHLSSKQ